MSVTLRHRGLPKDVTKYHLWDLVRDTASKGLKLTGRESQYIELAIKTCADADFLPKKICAFWMRVSKIAEKLGCTPRQVNSIEKSLEGKGLICRTMGRNGSRYVVRKKGGDVGDIELAVGINLAPMITQTEAWLEIRTVQQLSEKARSETRAEIQNIRRRIYASKSVDLHGEADAILPHGRTAQISDVEHLKDILVALQSLLAAIESEAGIAKTSDAHAEIADASEVSGRPNIQTQDSNRICTAPTRKAQKPLTAQQAVNLASPRYRAIVDSLGGASPANIVEASSQVCYNLDIGPRLWGDACNQLGREAAALRVLAIDRNCHLPADHKQRPRKPGGALVGILRRDRATGFNLNGMLRAIERYQEHELISDDASTPRPVELPLPGVKQVGSLLSNILGNFGSDSSGRQS
jgi:replication initiation protein RepC